MALFTTVLLRLTLTALVTASLATQVVELPSPAPAGSAQPNLVNAGDGRALLSWVEQITGGHQLRFATLNGDAWSKPQTIAEGKNWFVNWADFPAMVALPSGRLAAHWLQKSAKGTYDYDVRFAQSSDNGKTWADALTPHQDGVKAEHGFVSLLPAKDDHTSVVWLDGREMKAKQGHGHGHGPMTLRYAEVAANGTIRNAAELDPRVCECCQTSAAVGPDGPIVVYRDRSADEVRDIAITRLVQGSWTQPVLVCRDEWKVAGCPVNGPSIATASSHVVVAWFTAANGKSQVKLARSGDGGESFADAIAIDRGNPVGRVDVIVREDGTAWVCWLTQVADRGEVRVRSVSVHGKKSKTVTIAAMKTSRSGGFPRMIELKGKLLIAYRDGGVKTVTMLLP